MNQKDPLHASKNLPLISPSPPETSKPIIMLPHSSTGQEHSQQPTWSLPPNQGVMDLVVYGDSRLLLDW